MAGEIQVHRDLRASVRSVATLLGLCGVVIAASVAATLATDIVLIAMVVALGGAISIYGPPRLAQVAGAAAYIVLFELTYASQISQQFAYAGLLHSSADSLAMTAVMALAWLPSTVMPTRFVAPSQMVLWVMYLVVYVPATLVGFHIHGFLAEYQLLLMSGVALLLVVGRRPGRPLSLPRLGPKNHTRLLAVLTVLGMTYVIFGFGLTLSLPDLYDVYELRADYLARASAPFVTYVVVWLGYVLCPLLLAVAFQRRHIALAALAVTGSLLIYATAGFKAVVFVIPLVLVALVVAKLRDRAAPVLVWGLAGLVAASAVLAMVGNADLLTLVTRRALAVPGALTSYFHDYFTRHPTFELRHSVLGFLGESPYGDMNPALVVGRYIAERGGYANANVWADGMANFGWVGAVAAALALAVVLWFVDRSAGHNELAILVSAGAVAGFVFSQTALLTGLMSGGILVLWILLAIRGTDANADAGKATAQRHY